MKLEIGKRYVLRSGAITGPLEATDDENYPFGSYDAANEYYLVWDADGYYYDNRDESENDIVAAFDEAAPEPDVNDGLTLGVGYAHTAGPWRFAYTSAAQARKEALASGCNTDGGGATGFITAADPQNRYGQTVAFMPHNRDTSKDAECEANARLMASAPCMLAALEKAAQSLAAHDAVTKVLRESHNIPHTPCEVLAQVCAAIARATLP